MTICESRSKSIRRHIRYVQEDCFVIGDKLIDNGEEDFGFTLIGNGMKHDASKFSSPEKDHLWDRTDPLFERAWKHHIDINGHHPEHWGENGIHDMPRIYLYECVCDWHARSCEFGTCLQDWIEEVATEKFNFSKFDRVWADIEDARKIILEPRWS